MSMTMYTTGLPMTDVIYDLEGQLTRQDKDADRSVERLLAIVETHTRAEEEALASYRHMAETSGDPAVKLVMRLVLEDEERHHSLLQQIVNRMRDALNWTTSPDALPVPEPTSAEANAEMLALAKQLVREEKDGAKKVRDIAKLEKHVNYGLDSLLLEMMAADSEKHARLLQYVVQRLEAHT